jgi:hypothetical protein
MSIKNFDEFLNENENDEKVKKEIQDLNDEINKTTIELKKKQLQKLKEEKEKQDKKEQDNK